MYIRLVKYFIFLVSLISVSCINDDDPGEGSGYIVEIGDTAPDFTIEYLDGTNEKLNDFRGKTVMVQFAASWCGVCRNIMPEIENKIWKRFGDNEDFVLICVDYKESKEACQEFYRTTNITYPITLDLTGTKFELYADKNAGVTRNVLIDKDGKIVFLTRLFDQTEFSKLVEKIDELVNNDL